MSWLRFLRESIEAAQDRDPAARGALEVLLTYPGIHRSVSAHALMVHRITHEAALLGVPLLPRLISHASRASSPGSRSTRFLAIIGRRCFIDHGMGVVIGETTIIGDDCHLYQGVTLGGTSTRREKRHPTLEDGVVVGAGAKIIGDVTIGHNSRIGAGAVVVSSVPPNATVVGVPGHVVAFTNQSNDTVERLPDPEWDRIEELERRIARLERERQPTPTGSARARPAASTAAPRGTVAPARSRCASPTR